MSENIIEFTTIHSDNIKDIFETLKEMLQDVNILWFPDHLKIISINQSATICVFLKLTKSEIENNGSYYCKEPRITGVHIPTLYKLIKQISKNDIISLTINQSEPDYLFIKLLNDKKTPYKDLVYKLIENGDEQVEEIPPLNFGCEFIMLSSDFSKYIKDLSIFSHVMEIMATTNKITFSADGDFGKGKITIPDEDCINFNIDNNDEVIQSRFGLKFLQMFTKATNLNQNLKLYISTSPGPMMIEYNIPNMGVLRFILAPIADE